MPGFFVDSKYKRAYKFLEWTTKIIYTNVACRNVGMIGLVNESEKGNNSNTNSMRKNYYPTIWRHIRAQEDSLNVTSSIRLRIQMMTSAVFLRSRWSFWH